MKHGRLGGHDRLVEKVEFLFHLVKDEIVEFCVDHETDQRVVVASELLLGLWRAEIEVKMTGQ